jgi:signal transduction histidine kinase
LIARTRATGLPIDARVDRLPRGLPEGVDRAAYRIVQEALTNVTRHAPGATTHVRLHRDGRYLLVEVANGPAASGDVTSARNGAAGSGIRGMRERVRALGGEVDVGPQPAGGFRVQARLPLEPAR